MAMGPMKMQMLEVVRREQPITLAMLTERLCGPPKKSVKAALQDLRMKGFLRVENNGRTSLWMLGDSVPEESLREEKYRGGLSDWTKHRLANNTTEGEGDCVIWRGFITSTGAPVVYYHGKRAYFRRVIWEELHDKAVKPNMVVTSSCNTHGCCNPRHVVAMSKSALMDRSYATGSRQKGEKWRLKMALVRQSGSKIDWGMVRRIRACNSLSEAVRVSGLPKGTVAGIFRRKTWRNDPQDVWSSVFMRLAA